MPSPKIPHLAWPPRFALNGHLAANEQDSIEDIETCVVVSLLTPPGWRADEPQFGSRPEFPLLPLNTGALAAAITRDEPRAGIILTDDVIGREQLIARINARISTARGAS